MMAMGVEAGPVVMALDPAAAAWHVWNIACGVPFTPAVFHKHLLLLLMLLKMMVFVVLLLLLRKDSDRGKLAVEAGGRDGVWVQATIVAPQCGSEGVVGVGRYVGSNAGGDG